METFNEDPKPGRLVLPLVLIGMIATTYTFINRVSTNNNLEIEPVVEDIVETVEDAPEEETTTTTTTTLPDEVISYLEEISSEKIQSIDLATKVLEANDRWDNEEVSYQEAKDEFASFIDDDNIATYYVNLSTDPQFVADLQSWTETNTTSIEGPRGTALVFSINSQLQLRQSDYLFGKLIL